MNRPANQCRGVRHPFRNSSVHLTVLVIPNVRLIRDLVEICLRDISCHEYHFRVSKVPSHPYELPRKAERPQLRRAHTWLSQAARLPSYCINTPPCIVTLHVVVVHLYKTRLCDSTNPTERKSSLRGSHLLPPPKAIQYAHRFPPLFDAE